MRAACPRIWQNNRLCVIRQAPGVGMDLEKKPRKALETEVVDSGHDSQGAGDQAQWRARDPGQPPYGSVWTFSSLQPGGCLAPAITFALFMICLGQYGVLAAIGFFVFHTIGAVIGTLRASRLLASGILCNAWAWRVGNWVVSLLITIWLAGGFQN